MIAYAKPIITELTIAKKLITSLFEEKLKYNTEKNDEDDTLSGTINLNSSSLIVEFKSILKSSNVDYDSVMNYSLAIIEKKVKTIIETHEKLKHSAENETNISIALSSIIKFVFFIYAVSPRVNSTIKLSRILHLITVFSKTKFISIDEMHILHGEIFENVKFILKKNTSNRYNQVETLYLLTSLAQLGKHYRLSTTDLANIFGLELGSTQYSSTYSLNYFSLTVLLFYIKDIKKYSKIKGFVEFYLLQKLDNANGIVNQNTELLLLALDFISCPYVDTSLKNQALSKIGVTANTEQDLIKSLSNEWFTKWEGFNYGDELDKKRSLEVY